MIILNCNFCPVCGVEINKLSIHICKFDKDIEVFDSIKTEQGKCEKCLYWRYTGYSKGKCNKFSRTKYIDNEIEIRNTSDDKDREFIALDRFDFITNMYFCCNGFVSKR